MYPGPVFNSTHGKLILGDHECAEPLSCSMTELRLYPRALGFGELMEDVNAMLQQVAAQTIQKAVRAHLRKTRRRVICAMLHQKAVKAATAVQRCVRGMAARRAAQAIRVEVTAQSVLKKLGELLQVAGGV